MVKTIVQMHRRVLYIEKQNDLSFCGAKSLLLCLEMAYGMRELLEGMIMKLPIALKTTPIETLQQW